MWVLLFVILYDYVDVLLEFDNRIHVVNDIYYNTVCSPYYKLLGVIKGGGYNNINIVHR